jgi:hypothetical protein
MKPIIPYFIKTVLVAACLMVGYGFHRMSPHDPLVSVLFTVGILGLILSVNRKKKS